MVETFFGFKKTPFCDSPDPKQFFLRRPGIRPRRGCSFWPIITALACSPGKSAPVNRPLPAASPPHSIPTSIRSCICIGLADRRSICSANWRCYSICNRPTTAAIWCARSSQAIVHLNQSKQQHPLLICDEAQLLGHPALEQLPLLLNFDMDSSRYLTLLLVGQPLLRRTLSLQLHEPLRQRIAVQYHLEGLSREELDAYLAHQLKTAGVTQPLFDDTARQALYQATKGILRKVNKLALTALRLAASRKESTVGEAILLDATTEALL
jgi:hypothetical protein